MKWTEQRKLDFIADTLYHELRCLLGSATVWQVFKDEDAGFDVVIAADSAFLHARELFVFFTATGKTDVGVDDLVPSKRYPCALFDMWREPLNRHLFHVSKGRLAPNNVHNGVHLKDQVEVFAREILKLWIGFETDPDASAYKTALSTARTHAIDDAKNDARDRGQVLFTY